MKFISAIVVFSAAVASVSARPLRLSRRAVDPNLVPQFGVQAGVNPTGTGDCDGVTNAQGVPIKIPCFCPPDRNSFIASLNANVAAGHAVNNTGVQVSFPTDNSKASQLARLNAATISLQNLRDLDTGHPGRNRHRSPSTLPCPGRSSNFSARCTCVFACTAAGGVDPALVPEFGVQAGVNPTGTGDCDGIPNAQGVPIKIPCSCPPDRASFIQSLNANVAVGHAVNNPTVQLSANATAGHAVNNPTTFPTDNSKASKLARINAAVITLQNLHGPGVGCPVVSTTFQAQAQAIQNGP
ncbi:hypothetical protein BDZ97DRAFT_1902715 [Flammula alnicola]|nr:hypothetical protein BDZ97DRAFT_1902715 [Flammula alnicola]